VPLLDIYPSTYDVCNGLTLLRIIAAFITDDLSVIDFTKLIVCLSMIGRYAFPFYRFGKVRPTTVLGILLEKLSMCAEGEAGFETDCIAEDQFHQFRDTSEYTL